MAKPDRLRAVLELLSEHGRVEIDDLVTTLGISPATARRDLDTLAEQRMLTRTRGGAEALTVAYDLPLRYRDMRDPTAVKQRIAAAASALVRVGDVVGLSGGTTTTAIANALATRPDIMAQSHEPNLTVVTNAVNIAAELATRPQVKLMVSGGIVHPRSYELVGSFAEDTIGQVSLSIAFIGANALSLDHGATTHNEREAVVNALMATRADRAVLVVDSSKIGSKAFAAMGGPDKFDTIITDNGITDADHAALSSRGYEVIIAP
ncbi:DeoR family transcriptional regulator of aga operon [Leucobacter exalbidus]|uniref:DeoR family transcriptional regulator of aga operon n=1 Tax=Leucobacter exalbidus TaxID=662960 RepID=A0A940PX59_9MICO|nr:DeoR/GlpR family DNA-binding transcription regulator [Leucobacter exalbidus]MBP1326979.1 DeoR family transcriptional regulator of aga operon [Leucobacter exalbidus]